MTREEINNIKEWLSKNIVFTYSYSGGPGGQNVNKLNTKVTARISVNLIPYLDEISIDRLRKRLKNKINKNDEIVIQVQTERSQQKNKTISITRMQKVIINALTVKKLRKPTKTPQKLKEKRLKTKKIISEKKELRKSPDK